MIIMISLVAISTSLAAEIHSAPYELATSETEIKIDSLNFKWHFKNMKVNHLYQIRVSHEILTNNTAYTF